MICMMPQTQVVVSGQQHHQPIHPIDVSIAMAVLLLVSTTDLLTWTIIHTNGQQK